jgi:hypothetical protein
MPVVASGGHVNLLPLRKSVPKSVPVVTYVTYLQTVKVGLLVNKLHKLPPAPIQRNFE